MTGIFQLVSCGMLLVDGGGWWRLVGAGAGSDRKAGWGQAREVNVMPGRGRAAGQPLPLPVYRPAEFSRGFCSQVCSCSNPAPALLAWLLTRPRWLWHNNLQTRGAVFAAPLGGLQTPLASDPAFWNVFNVSYNQLTGDVPAYLTNPNSQVDVELAGNLFRCVGG